MVLIQDMTEPRAIGEALENRVTRLIGLGVELEESAVGAASSRGSAALEALLALPRRFGRLAGGDGIARRESLHYRGVECSSLSAFGRTWMSSIASLASWSNPRRGERLR